MTARTHFLFGFFILLVFVAYNGFYTVQQSESALLFRLGDLKKDADGEIMIMEPGLHFMVPFINNSEHYDRRYQTLEVEPTRVFTAKLQEVMVQYYAKWRIEDLGLYYKRTGGNALLAKKLLRQKLDGSLRAEFGTKEIAEVVAAERGNIMKRLYEQANESAEPLGIEVIDVRINQIDLPEQVSAKVFDNMRAYREQSAIKYRADGKAQAEKVKAEADRQATVIVAEAREKGQEIRAKGDADAAKTYADTYKKNPDFYAFYRSLQAYQNSFANKHDILVMQPSGQFFKFLNNAEGTPKG